MRAWVLVFAACGPKPSPTPPSAATPAPTTTTLSNAAAPPQHDPVIITLARTACLGWCPVYKLELTVAGRVRYVGEDYVKVKGEQIGSIAAGDMEKLVAAFDAAKLDAYPALLDGKSLDVPELDISYRGKTIHYTPGVYMRGTKQATQFETIDALSEAVDAAANVERWTGTNTEREALWDAEMLERAKQACEKKPPDKRRDCYEDHGVTPP